MPIVIIDGFELNADKPIDYRIIASSSTDRLAITYLYDGLKVFQIDNRRTYIWNSGTSNWDSDGDGNIVGYGLTGYMPYFYSETGLTNSVIYQSSGNIGLNTTDAKTNLQISGNFVGSAQPLTFNISGDARMAYNWYYDVGDQTFNSTKGSSRIIFGDGDLTLGTRKPSASNGAFIDSIYISTIGEPYLTSDNRVRLIGNTVSITATSSVSISNGQIKISSISYSGDITITATVSGTYSISGSENLNIRSGNFPVQGYDLTLSAGKGISIGMIDSTGGSIYILGGNGANSGTGGSISIAGGYNPDSGERGNIFIDENLYTKSVYRNVREISPTSAATFSSTSYDHFIYINPNKFADSGSRYKLPSNPNDGREIFIKRDSTSMTFYIDPGSGIDVDIDGTSYATPGYTLSSDESLHLIYIDSLGGWYKFN